MIEVILYTNRRDHKLLKIDLQKKFANRLSRSSARLLREHAAFVDPDGQSSTTRMESDEYSDMDWR